MDNRINFQQLVELFARASGMSKNVSEQFVKNFFDIISNGVLEEGLVKVKGLGTFKLVDTENRESVNVNTGERIVIEGRRKINFIPEAGLKEFINQPFAAFDTVSLSEVQVEELARMDGEANGESPASAVTDAADSSDAEVSATDIPAENVQENQIDPELARKVAAVKAMVKEKQIKEENASVETQEADADAEADAGLTSKPLDNNGSGAVTVGPMLPDGRSQDGGTRFLSPFVAMALKVLAWILSIIVVIWVIVYAVWPAVAVAIFRDMEAERKYSHASAIQQRLEQEQLMYLNSDTIQVSADTLNAAADSLVTDVIADSMAQTVAGNDFVEQPSVLNTVSNSASKPISDRLVLLEADEKRDLSEFSDADTVNYLIAGVLAEHEIQPGETLSKLALKYYGTKKLWPYIAKFNKYNANRINTGDIISIPVLVNR